MSTERTVVHVVRHGEVHNPGRILYGRLEGYHLSERGRAMAQVVADHLADADIAAVIASPLSRAQETAAPIAERHGLPIDVDERVIEGDNAFEGQSVGLGTFLAPRNLKLLRDPRTPSWGEPYAVVAERMTAAIAAARDRVRGQQAVIVSHQLPIWMARLAAEERRLWHNPRSRQCSLASITAFHYEGSELTSISYSEPAHALLDEDTASVGA